MEAVKRLEALLPERLVREAGALPEDLFELRIRAGRPVQLIGGSGEMLRGGAVSAELVEQTARSLAGHSLYAREEELREGYFTIEGGIRVGVCGRMPAPDGRPLPVTHIGSLCIRLAREIRGAADGVMDALWEGGCPVSAAVVSPPGMGKTTLLRDIARQLSDGTGGRRGVRVAVADERGEIAGCVLGVPMLDVGARTDVMDGCPRREAMRLMVRAMSPEVIVTDELGHESDAEAVADAMRSGVRVIASVHADSRRGAGERLGHAARLFGRMILLGGRPGQVIEIVDLMREEQEGWMRR